MIRYLFLLAVLIQSIPMNAQFNYWTPNEHFPVTGPQIGLVGLGYTATLQNTVDNKADYRLDPQLMNFQYGFGVEMIRWGSPNFGWGVQFLYSKGGAYYTGKTDTTEFAYSLKGRTDLQYAKVPLLFYWKSYNRYKNDKRFGLTAYFGPYIAGLISYNDEYSLERTIDDVSEKYTYTYSNNTFKYKSNQTPESENYPIFDKYIYDRLDAGLVVGIGAEYRFWRRTIVGLTLRSDLGFRNVEYRDNIDYKIKNDPIDTTYTTRVWDYLSLKYYNNPDPTKPVNRGVTRNFTVGIQLSIKKYLYK